MLHCSPLHGGLPIRLPRGLQDGPPHMAGGHDLLGPANDGRYRDVYKPVMFVADQYARLSRHGRVDCVAPHLIT